MRNLIPDLDPEFEALLLFIRPVLSTQAKARLQTLLHSGLNWTSLIEYARAYGVVPLFSRGLNNERVEFLPEAALEQIQVLNFAIVRRNLFLTKELLSLLELFGNNNIPVIPYKGPVLVQTLYGDIALRPFEDIDLLILRKDVHRARDLLIRNGYNLTWPQIHLTGSQDDSHLQAKYNYKFEREMGRLAVELHWGITPKYFSLPPDPRWLWQGLEPASLAGTTVLTFSPENYLLILCMHGANHCWLYRLTWICDIAELLCKHTELNWEYILESARSFGAQRILLLGLLLANDLLGSVLPDETWRRINADHQVRSLASQAIAQFAKEDGGSPGAFYIPRFQINARERLQDKLRYYLYMSKPSVKDWASLPLPLPLAFLYYIFRPLRLLIEHGLLPLRARLRLILNSWE